MLIGGILTQQIDSGSGQLRWINTIARPLLSTVVGKIPRWHLLTASLPLGLVAASLPLGRGEKYSRAGRPSARL